MKRDINRLIYQDLEIVYIYFVKSEKFSLTLSCGSRQLQVGENSN